jgi:hypothetical protein
VLSNDGPRPNIALGVSRWGVVMKLKHLHLNVRDGPAALIRCAAVDPRAEHGLGVRTVRFEDGSRLSVALVGDTESMFLPPK